MRGRPTRRAAPFALLGLLCAAQPAAAQPRLNLPGGTQPGGLRTPLEAGGQCTECHSGLETSDNRRYLPADLWPTSMMANASRDPLFRATLSVAEQQRPNIGELCLRCHTPAGFVAGHGVPGNGSALDPFSENDGVNCDTCHRSVDGRDTDPMAPYIGNARLFFSDGTDTTAPTRFGPRADPTFSPRHPAMRGEFISDSRMCGQCHDVDNPLLNRLLPDGTDTGQPFPLQSTYTEWAQSEFSRGSTLRSCQNCHMPAETEALPVTRIPGAPARPMHRRHDFLGANEWGMAMLRAAFPDEMDSAFDEARVRQRGFLQTSARLELLDVPAQVRAGEPLNFRVRVTNLSGHKLPTGYEDARLMWLQVELAGRVVSGAMVDDELVEDPQVRTYRFIPGHREGGRAVPGDFVTQHQVILEDTRIPPAGMMPTARTAPVGRDYSGGLNGALRHDDTAMYSFAAPAVGGSAELTVRLLYRTTTRHYVETIAAANQSDNTGTRLLQVWNAAGRAPPFAIATQQATVQVTGGAPDASVADVPGLVDASVTADTGTTAPGGCGCRAAGSSRSGMSTLGALALAALASRRRRRGAREERTR
ncbi:MAG: cytochrome c3 family protein [Polyangiales bacterium]